MAAPTGSTASELLWPPIRALSTNRIPRSERPTMSLSSRAPRLMPTRRLSHSPGCSDCASPRTPWAFLPPTPSVCGIRDGWARDGRLSDPVISPGSWHGHGSSSISGPAPCSAGVASTPFCTARRSSSRETHGHESTQNWAGEGCGSTRPANSPGVSRQCLILKSAPPSVLKARHTPKTRSGRRTGISNGCWLPPGRPAPTLGRSAWAVRSSFPALAALVPALAALVPAAQPTSPSLPEYLGRGVACRSLLQEDGDHAVENVGFRYQTLINLEAFHHDVQDHGPTDDDVFPTSYHAGTGQPGSTVLGGEGPIPPGHLVSGQYRVVHQISVVGHHLLLQRRERGDRARQPDQTMRRQKPGMGVDGHFQRAGHHGFGRGQLLWERWGRLQKALGHPDTTYLQGHRFQIGITGSRPCHQLGRSSPDIDHEKRSVIGIEVCHRSGHRKRPFISSCQQFG